MKGVEEKSGDEGVVNASVKYQKSEVSKLMT